MGQVPFVIQTSAFQNIGEVGVYAIQDFHSLVSNKYDSCR